MRIHYFAAARAAAGVAVEEVGAYATLGDALAAAAKRHTGTTDSGHSLAEIMERCTFLVDGKRAELGAALESAERIDVLPPFAGG